jgi:hypothetical protein
MADFTFLFNRKGALYPLDFAASAPPARAVATDSQLNPAAPIKPVQTTSEWPFNSMFDSTLVHLCAKVVVSMPSAEIERITDLIPAELFTALFKASLYPVKDNAIDVIL